MENSAPRPKFRAEEITSETIENLTPPKTTSPMQPGSHTQIPGNKTSKPSIFAKLFFLVPALLIVATIALVANFTRSDYVINEERQAVPTAISNFQTPISTPTPTPKPLFEEFSNSYFSFNYSSKLLMFECDSLLCLGPEEGKEAITFQYLNSAEEPEEDAFNRLYLAADRKLLIRLFDNNLESEFQQIIDSLVLKVNISQRWEIFENSEYGYYIKYPQDWNLVNQQLGEVEIGPKSIIRKDNSELKLQNLTIEVLAELENAAISATEAVSSTRNLLGWEDKPDVKITSLGGVNAQVISGVFEGNWQEYIVVWYRNTVIQMIWTDDLTRNNQQEFDEMLKTFQVF